MNKNRRFAMITAGLLAAGLGAVLLLPIQAVTAGPPASDLAFEVDFDHDGVCPTTETGFVIGYPPPSCPATLGACTQIGSSCCYTCPGLPFGICINF